MQQFRVHESQLLSQYAWLDQKQGIVRIPVDRAMALVLERGLPKPDRPRQRDESRPATPTPEIGGKDKKADDD